MDRFAKKFDSISVSTWLILVLVIESTIAAPWHESVRYNEEGYQGDFLIWSDTGGVPRLIRCIHMNKNAFLSDSSIFSSDLGWYFQVSTTS